MTYQTGTATDIDDLINVELKAFLQSEGWTVNDDSWPNNLSVSKNSVFVNFRRRGESFGSVLNDNNFTDAFGASLTDSFVRIAIASGYNGTPATADERWYSQPDNTGTNTSSTLAEAWANDLTGPISSYIFMTGGSTGDQYVHVVAEGLSGHFTHFGFGESHTPGSTLVTSPAYVYGTYYYWWPQTTSYSSRADVDMANGLHRVLTSVNSANIALYQGSSGDTENIKSRTEVLRSLSLDDSVSLNRVSFDMGLASASANGLNGVSPTYPVILAGDLAANSNAFYFLGSIPDLRIINNEYIAPKEEVSFGGDTWVVVPVRRKEGGYGSVSDAPDTYPYKNTSGYLALAYRKVS